MSSTPKKYHSVSSSIPGVPTSVSWCWDSADGVAFVSQRGPLYIWVYGGPDPGVTVHKEAHSFLSDICLFRWHPTKKGKLVFGHTDGSLSIFQPGTNVFLNLLNTKLKLAFLNILGYYFDLQEAHTASPHQKNSRIVYLCKQVIKTQ